MIILLSDIGWINAITVSLIFFFYFTFGFYCLYQTLKKRVKLLFYLGIASIFAGLIWIGNLIDFFAILATGTNIDNQNGFVGILNAVWIAPSAISFLLIAVRILFPKKSRYLLVSLIILGVLFEIFLLTNPSRFLSYIYPPEPGTDLIEDNYIFESLTGVIFLIFLFLILSFYGIGLVIKGFQYKGVLRKKIIYISIGASLMMLCAIFDVIAPPGILLILVRLLWIICLVLIYYGVKEEIEKPMQIESKKEVKVEGDLFRLIKTRPSEITEEEITYLKELKKCLVCKGNAEGFNIYVCPSCGALYCQRCAHTLSELENVCWSCNGPIDKSKPSKPYKNIKAEVHVEQKDKKI